jgi:rubrerythrin
MSEQTNLLVAAFKTAIEIENNGLVTYLKFARKTRDEFGKNMFIQLALDEFEHRQILENQLRKLNDSGELKAPEIPLTPLEQVVPKIKDKTQRIKGESGLADTDALDTALEMERKSARFFTEQAAATPNNEVRALFERLARWEETHYDIILAELDAIQHTGFWFGMPEFRMDGKF